MTGLAQLFSDIASILNGLYGNIKFSLVKSVTGLDDATYTGVFSGNVPSTSVVIAIDATGTPDTFSFTYGSSTQTGIKIIVGDMDLVDGIKINFAATTGHTVGDSWTLNITSEKLLKTIRLWNNQIKNEDDAQYADFAKPACFVEFSNIIVQTLGGGQSQIYDNLLIILHLCHEFYDAQDGTFEQDLPVFEIKQRIYAALQRQKNTMAVILNRDSEEMDYDHDNIIHYKMNFKANQIDDTVLIPDGYIIKYPDTNPVIDIQPQ